VRRPWADPLWALALFGAGCAELASSRYGVTPVRVLLLAAITLPLALRRRMLTVPVVLIAAAGAVPAHHELDVSSFATGLALVSVTFSTLELRPPRRGIPLLALLAAAAVVGLVLGGRPGDIGWAVGVFVVAPAILGHGVRDRRERIAALRAVNAQLAAERERTAALAAAAERARIAADLRGVLERALRDMTARACEAIRTEGAAAAGELRRLLGLLS
jgi:signal transduction histidine kinase